MRGLRRTRKTVLLPFWLGAPLAFLGAVYVVFFPLGLADWAGYVLALAIAAVLGSWMRSRWKVTILERSERGVVLWMRRVERKKSTEAARPPKIEVP